MHRRTDASMYRCIDASEPRIEHRGASIEDIEGRGSRGTFTPKAAIDLFSPARRPKRTPIEASRPTRGFGR